MALRASKDHTGKNKEEETPSRAVEPVVSNGRQQLFSAATNDRIRRAHDKSSENGLEKGPLNNGERGRGGLPGFMVGDPGSHPPLPAPLPSCLVL